MEEYTNSELREELKKADELNGLKDRRIARLEAENSSTKAQLDALLQQQNSNGRSGDATERLPENDRSVPSGCTGPVSRSAFDALQQKYARLELRCEELGAEHAKCQRAMEEARARAKDYKARAKQWKAYIDDWEKKHPKAICSMTPASPKDVNSSQQQQDRNALDLTPQQQKTFAATKPQSNGQPYRNAEVQSDASTPHTSGGLMQSEDCSHSSVPRITSSQTTMEDTGAPNSSPKRDSNSDSEPIFVSARSLKRKAVTGAADERPNRRIKEEPSSPVNMVNLAVDEAKDDPILPQESDPRLPTAFVTEMSDLDAIGEPMVTPQLSSKTFDRRARATSEAATRFVPHLGRSASTLSDGAVPGSRRGSRAPLSCKSEQGLEVSKPDIEHESCRPLEGSGTAQRPSDVNILQPISANLSGPIQYRRACVEGNAKAGSKTRHDTARARLALVSEGGDDISQLAGRTYPEPQAGGADGLVTELLLNEKSPEKTPNQLRRPRISALRERQIQSPAQARTPVSISKAKSPVQKGSSLNRRKGLEALPPPVQPEEEPLRSRDSRTLRLNDFKINPKYLGSDFAFADTLRGRDQRRALHSCTRPDCCGGALQRAIAMGGAALSGKTDNQALEEYLGPNYAHIISNYSPDKRRETLNQAHAHCFSRQHGKHRHAFERQKTPPGYWNTDFPTTQEAANERQQALELQKRQIDERYRDAMKGGGKWIFRDE